MARSKAYNPPGQTQGSGKMSGPNPKGVPRPPKRKAPTQKGIGPVAKRKMSKMNLA